MIQIVTYNIFVDVFGNLLTDVLFGVFILVGILIGVFLRPFVGNGVTKIIPSEHRFEDFDIEEETAISITCKDKKGFPPHKFYKCWPGYTGMAGRFIKRSITKFFGREGTAYTWHFKDDKKIELGTLAQAIKHLWGEDFYDTIPDRQKRDLEESKINVTVNLESDDSLTPAGMRTISEENIKQEEDREAAKTFWKGKSKADRNALINLILGIGTGFGICATLVLLGIFKGPAAEPAATPAPEAAAQMIQLALMRLVHGA